MVESLMNMQTKLQMNVLAKSLVSILAKPLVEMMSSSLGSILVESLVNMLANSLVKKLAWSLLNILNKALVNKLAWSVVKKSDYFCMCSVYLFEKFVRSFGNSKIKCTDYIKSHENQIVKSCIPKQNPCKD